jgi:hypothetical protein
MDGGTLKRLFPNLLIYLFLFLFFQFPEKRFDKILGAILAQGKHDFLMDECPKYRRMVEAAEKKDSKAKNTKTAKVTEDYWKGRGGRVGRRKERVGVNSN